MKSKLIILLLPWSFSFAIQAKQISTPFLNFQISNRWDCQFQDPLAYVCRLQQNQPVQDALIIVSAKEAGPEDNFNSFQKYLGMPKPLQAKGATPSISKVQYVKILDIHKQKWTEGLHLNSEIEGYSTRYLATVKGKLSVLVTLSAAQNHWKFFEQDFKMAVQTLQLTNNPIIFSDPYRLGRNQNMQNPQQKQLASTSPPAAKASRKQASVQVERTSSPPNYALMGIAALAVLGLVIYAVKS
jgi:hypothetical protein